MAYGRLITSDPAVMMGKPVVANTRVTVEAILEKLAAGESVEQIPDEHPRLNRDAIQAALDEHSAEISGNFPVVSPGVFRIRRRI